MTFKPLRCLAPLAVAGFLSASVAVAAPEIAPAEIAKKAEKSLLVSIARAGDRLVAVGAYGHILLSDDNAVSWRQVDVPVNNLLTELYFLDAKRGWVVGHDATILFTEDGGETWAIQHFDASMEPFFDVLFFDEQRGVAIGAYGQAMMTSDAGANWTMADSELAGGMHLNSIARLNDGSYLVVGESGLVALSSDAGVTWRLLEAPFESSLFSVAPFGPSGALVGGLRGNVFTIDNVLTGSWREVETGTVQSVFGIDNDGAGGFWMAGLNGSLLHADPNLNVTPADTRVANGAGGEENLIATAIGGVAYSDVMTLDDETLVVVGDSGVKRMGFTR